MTSAGSKLAAGLGAIVLCAGLVGCGDDDGPDDDIPATTSSTSQAPTDGDGDSSTVDLYDRKFAISWEDALKTARSEFKGDVAKIELEADDRGRYHYDIDLLSPTKKFEIEIDTTSGDIIKKKTEDLDADDKAERANEIVDLGDVISLKDAMDTARQEQRGPINSWKLEGDDRDGPQYEFDFDRADGSGEDNDVKVDARTGKVIPDTED